MSVSQVAVDGGWDALVPKGGGGALASTFRSEGAPATFRRQGASATSAPARPRVYLFDGVGSFSYTSIRKFYNTKP